MDGQLTLFNLDEYTDWKKEWIGMPEFVQEDLTPFHSIELEFEYYFDVKGHLIKDRILRVHFEDREAILDLGKLLGISGLNHTINYIKYNIEGFRSRIKQNITENTRSIWFPEAEIGHFIDKRYDDES